MSILFSIAGISLSPVVGSFDKTKMTSYYIKWLIVGDAKLQNLELKDTALVSLKFCLSK